MGLVCAALGAEVVRPAGMQIREHSKSCRYSQTYPKACNCCRKTWTEMLQLCVGSSAVRHMLTFFTSVDKSWRVNRRLLSLHPSLKGVPVKVAELRWGMEAGSFQRRAKAMRSSQMPEAARQVAPLPH